MYPFPQQGYRIVAGICKPVCLFVPSFLSKGTGLVAGVCIPVCLFVPSLPSKATLLVAGVPVSAVCTVVEEDIMSILSDMVASVVWYVASDSYSDK